MGHYNCNLILVALFYNNMECETFLQGKNFNVFYNNIFNVIANFPSLTLSLSLSLCLFFYCHLSTPVLLKAIYIINIFGA
jgi:hypothetical protein